MAILYGIKKCVVTELDPSTGKPAVESPKTIHFKTAEEASLEPVFSEGAEEVLRSPEAILAVVRTDDLLYGYNLTLKDNQFNIDLAGLVAGYSVTGADDATKIATPKMAEGFIGKAFQLDIYVGNYEGDDLVNYTKITFSKCIGKFPSMKIGKEFFAPEFEIKCRENTKAKLPIKEISFVTELPADPVVSPE